jgi:WD40 repeat protein
LIGMVGHGAAVTAVAFTRDNKTLISANSYGVFMVWDLPKGLPPRHRFTKAASTSPIYSIACHPNNKIIGLACFDNTVRLYDISGKLLKEAGQVDGHTKAVYAAAYSPDGKTLATGSEDLSARLWDTSTNPYKEISRINNHTAGVRSVAFTTSGKTLATGCLDGTIRLWNVPASSRPKAPRIFHQGPKGAVTSLSFSSTGQTLAATCGDKTARLWDVSKKLVRERFALEGHQDPVNSVCYSPDMKLLVTGSDDWTCRTWDLRTGKPVERFVPKSHLSHIYSCAFSPDGQSMATGSYDRVVRFWDIARPDPKTRNYEKGDKIRIYVVAYSPDGKLIAAGGESSRIRQWDAIKGTTKPTLVGAAGYVYHIAYSPDGKRLLSASDKSAYLFDAIKGKEIQRFSKHETQVHCIGFSPDTRQVLTGSGYYLYDKMGKIVVKNGKYVYTDCILHLWDAEKGDEIASIKDSETPFYSTSFSADGRSVFAGAYEASVRRWNISGDKLSESPRLKATSGYAYRLLPTPDGKQLITVGLDYQVSLWDLASGKRVREWTFPETLGGVALSHDSRHLAVGLGTGVVYILRLGPATAKLK